VKWGDLPPYVIIKGFRFNVLELQASRKDRKENQKPAQANQAKATAQNQLVERNLSRASRA
jgi:hypothetical protein